MRTWRTFAGVCWTGKRFDFDGGAQEILGRWTESPSHGLAVPAPFRQGGQGDGSTDCHTSVRTGFAMTRFFARSGVQGRLGRTEASAPTEGNKKPCGAGRRGRRPLRMGRGVRIATASDIGHWFAMTRFFARSAVQGRLGRTEASAPTDGYKECNGRATARVAPTEALQGVRWRR